MESKELAKEAAKIRKWTRQEQKKARKKNPGSPMDTMTDEEFEKFVSSLTLWLHGS